jgi:hypothetical protein
MVAIEDDSIRVDTTLLGTLKVNVLQGRFSGLKSAMRPIDRQVPCNPGDLSPLN